MNALRFRKILLALAAVILVSASGQSGVLAQQSSACSFDDILAKRLGELEMNALPTAPEIRSIYEEVNSQKVWEAGPFTSAGLVVENYEADGSHVTPGECFALRQKQPGNSKVLHFEAVDCGVTDKWGEGVYVAKQDCANEYIYWIRNANVDGHLHTVKLYVVEFDDDDLPKNFLYRFVSDDLTFEHPGHGKAQ